MALVCETLQVFENDATLRTTLVLRCVLVTSLTSSDVAFAVSSDVQYVPSWLAPTRLRALRSVEPSETSRRNVPLLEVPSDLRDTRCTSLVRLPEMTSPISTLPLVQLRVPRPVVEDGGTSRGFQHSQHYHFIEGNIPVFVKFVLCVVRPNDNMHITDVAQH